MFVCDECAKSEGVNEFYMMLFRSYGDCELCGKVRSCGDVPHHAFPRLDKSNQTEDEEEI